MFDFLPHFSKFSMQHSKILQMRSKICKYQIRPLTACKSCGTYIQVNLISFRSKFMNMTQNEPNLAYFQTIVFLCQQIDICAPIFLRVENSNRLPFITEVGVRVVSYFRLWFLTSFKLRRAHYEKSPLWPSEKLC